MKLVKATTISVLSFILLLGTLFLFFSEPSASYKASEAQGTLYLSLVGITAFLSISFVFPLSAYLLSRKLSFTKRKWTHLVFIGVGSLGVVVSIIAHFSVIGGMSIISIATLWGMVFLLSILILTPFSYLWLANAHT